MQAELSAGGRVPGVQDKKPGGHGGTDEGELPERNLVWLTYQGLVAPSDKEAYFTSVPCWRVGGASWRTQARILGHNQAERQNLGRGEAQNEGGRRKTLGLEVKASTRLSEQPPS